MMSIHLDHLIIPSKNREAAARRLASLLGVGWAPAKIGPFTAVYVNEGFTIDFDEWTGDIPQGHYCFRVDETTFEAVLGRLAEAGMPYRSLPHGPVDYQVNTSLDGRIVYWAEPDGHVWELLTQSDAHAADSPRAGMK